MDLSRQRIHELFHKMASNTCTQAELQEFFALVRERDSEELVISELDAWWENIPPGMAEGYAEQQDKIRKRISSMMQDEHDTRVHSTGAFAWRRWAAAAAVVLIVVTGVLMWLRKDEKGSFSQAHSKSEKQSIEPGRNGAVLTLADGTEVVLDSLGDGLVTVQQGSKVMLTNGQLAYAVDPGASGPAAWNTITTSKGRQFRIVLPDGTAVWMNADSYIRYPTYFSGAYRSIQVMGEVYMEVAKNKDMPFRVNVRDEAEIEVLGTSFNINSYDNEENISTSLLEGSVKLVSTRSDKSVLLVPGQQGLVDGPALKTTSFVVDKVLAWKNGFFNFEGTSLKEAMKQLERWYDITVIYEKNVPDIQFFGEISRNINLEDLLDVFKDVGLHFRIESGRRLIVLP